jgi:alkylhydroperoxidase/carboxymuconolactone decarboxylase family protein YurZ
MSSETKEYKENTSAVTGPPTGPWDSALDTLRELDPKFAELCFRMSTNPWTHPVLPRKFIELVSVGLNAACTNLNADGTRRHIRAALDAGATREEILFVLKCASVLGIHCCSLAAPIVLEEAKAANVKPTPRATTEPTPACDVMRKIGQWNTAWDPFFALDPVFTDEFMAMGGAIYKSGLMPPKEVELLSIALDASFTHMYAPGVRRHINNSLKAGATMEEIMEVLKLCVAQGVQTFNLGLPILVEELERHSSNQKAA